MGTRIFRMLLNLATSNYALNKNHQELMLAINGFENNIKIWDITKRNQFEAFLWELSRLFQNYLSSYYSLIKHTEQFCRELSCHELSNEYSERVKILRRDDFVRFVYDLRTFSQHFGLPLLEAEFSLKKSEKNDKAADFKQRILLQKTELLKWKKWSTPSKNYINSNKEIDLKLVMIEHYSLIKTFYEWFYKKVTEIFSKPLQEYAEIESQISALQPK